MLRCGSFRKEDMLGITWNKNLFRDCYPDLDDWLVSGSCFSVWHWADSHQSKWTGCCHLGCKGKGFLLGSVRMSWDLLVSFLVSYLSLWKIPWESSLREKVVYSVLNPRLQPITVGRTGTASPIHHQEQRDKDAYTLTCSCSLGFSSLIQLRICCPGNGVKHSWLGLPTSTNLMKTIL